MATPQYLFILGNAPELAEEELASVLPDRPLDAFAFSLLGGAVKVAEIFNTSIVDGLARGKEPGDRIIFGLSGDVTVQDAKKVKGELENLGFKARFVLPKAGENELSSVVITKQKISEIYIIGDIKAKTIWVQDFEDWGKRDYGRPAVAAHVGMLPPKVARMMVNIGARGQGLGAREFTILDPFCGVGTILAEGLTIGAKVIGVDIDVRQMERTKKNLEWLADEYNVSSIKYKVFESDAREISSRIEPGSVDAIVTEPDLGPNIVISEQLRMKNYGKLEKLYLDCLEDWKQVLKSNGRVVIVFPSFRADNSFVKTLVDKVKIMGYSLVSGPFPYFRPQAEVRRNICVFELATSS